MFRFRDSGHVPENLEEAYEKCEELQFPNLHVLLKIAMTLPVSSTSVSGVLAHSAEYIRTSAHQ